MAIVEFQMSTAAFLKAQRNALLQRQICLPGPFAFNAVNGAGTVTIVLDRIDFGANALVHDVEEDFQLFEKEYGGLPDDFGVKEVIEGFKTQMTQDVTVHVTTLEDILSHPNQSPATVVPVQGTLVFDVSAYAIVDTGLFMRVQFQPKDSTIVPPPGAPPLPIDWDALTQTIMTEIAKFLPSPAIPIDLKGVGASGRFINAGISVDSTLSRLALRADNSLYPYVVPWTNFYQGVFDDRLGGNEWALFIHENFMGSVIDANIDAGLGDLPEEVEIIPHTTYSNAGGRAVFTINLNILADAPGVAGDIMNAFPCLAGTGHADVQIPMEFSLGSPLELVTEADVSTIQQQVQDHLGLAGTLIDILGISLQGFIDAGAASALSEVGDAAGKCEITPAHHIRCTRPIKAPSVGFGAAFHIGSLLALVDGISLAGDLGMVNLSPAVLDVGARPLQLEAPIVNCGSAGMSTIAAFGANPRAWEILHGFIGINNQGTAPLFLCDYQVVGNDWANAFPRSGIRPDGTLAPITVAVRFAAPPDRYYTGDGPGRPGNYPCVVLIKTTGGTRALSLGPAPLITQEKLEQLRAELLVKVGNCQILTDNWWDGDHAHIPEWHVPDPPDYLVDHHWQFFVKGLEAGDAAALVDARGRRVALAYGQANAPVHLSAVLRPVAGQRDVTLVRIPAANMQRTFGRRILRPSRADQDAAGVGPDTSHGEGEREARGIGVSQQSLIMVGSAPLTAPCVDVVSARRLGTRMFVAVMPESLAAYDVSQPLRPLLIGEWSFAGARGALPWQGGVLAFGDEGFAVVDEAGLQRPGGRHCSVPPVLAAATAGRRLYALTDGGVAIHDGRLCKLKTVELGAGNPVPRSMAAAAGAIVMGGEEGIMTLSIDDPAPPRRMRAECHLCVRRLSTPATHRGEGRVLAELEDGSARLLDVGDGHVRELAWFVEPPWFSRAARAGNVLAHRAADANRLEFYRLGGSDLR